MTIREERRKEKGEMSDVPRGTSRISEGRVQIYLGYAERERCVRSAAEHNNQRLNE